MRDESQDEDLDLILSRLESGMLLDIEEGRAEARISDIEKHVRSLQLPKKEEEVSKDLRTWISSLTFPKKLKLATLGDGAVRGVLIGDSNAMVAEAVLSNPRLTLHEVEEFSKNPNISDGVLRIIARNRDWTKSYQVKRSLLFNPKTPLAISLIFVKSLALVDLKKLARSKNIPGSLMTCAKKLLDDKKRQSH